MYNEDYMYAVDRSDEYLAHYGIRGMRWGVRKALASGNERRLAKHQARAQKKLAKLQRQATSQDKYNKRAARLAAGAAVAGGLAAAGTEGLGRGISKLGLHTANAATGAGRMLQGVGGHSAASKLARKAGSSLVKAGSVGGPHGMGAIQKGFGAATKGVMDWGNSKSISNALINNNANAMMKIQKLPNNAVTNAAKSGLGSANRALNGVSNNTIARIGAGAVGAGLLGAAAYNKYRASHTDKAAAKAARFEKAMNETFANTKYGRRPKKRNTRRG